MVTLKLDPLTVPKYINPLPNLLTPRLFIDARSGGTYDISMSQGDHNFGLGAAFTPTAAWGYHSGTLDENGEYSDSLAPLWEELGLNYLGPTIVAQEEVPISVNWINGLPVDHLLDADDTPHGAHESLEGGVRVQPHVHGGLTVASSDGNPFATDAFLGTEIYNYRNAQDPATIWYHDHALGITRLNVYAGLAGFYIIRDDQDTGEPDNPLNLPANIVDNGGTPDNPADDTLLKGYEFPIAIQDKTFDVDGNLYYPAIPGDPLAGIGNPVVPVVPGVDAFGTVNPFPDAPNSPTVVAEYGGDVMIVNGVAWPTLNVEPRTYRFRLLNGSDSRFYEMRLNQQTDTGILDPNFQVIGSDNGLLDGPAVSTNKLPIGPGERYDVIVDFSQYAGQTITLRNKQGANGSRPIFNDPQTTGQIMQFTVGDTVTEEPPVDPELGIPQWQIDLRPDPADTIPVWTKNIDGTWQGTRTLVDPETGEVLEVQDLGSTTAPGDHALAIFEGLDDYGRLFPHLGTVNEGSLLWAEDPFSDNNSFIDPTYPGDAIAAPAETITADEYTLFEIYNTTPDAHPIHLHGTEFQVLERQKIKFTLIEEPTYTEPYDPLTNPNNPPPAYLTSRFVDTNGDGDVNTDDITLIGTAKAAAAYESGFKDTAIVNPGEMIAVVAKFDQALLNEDPLDFGKGKYVWHCHILSHEDHEMMRPLQLVAPESSSPLSPPPEPVVI